MKANDTVGWVNGPVPVIEPEHLTRVFADVSDLAFVIMPDGKIRSILVDTRSDDHVRVGQWAGHSMQDFLASESLPKFEAALAALADGHTDRKPVELNHADGDDWKYPVRYTFHPIVPGASILMLGQNLRYVAETQERLVQAQIALEQGYEERREYDARYRILMSSSAEARIFVSATDGLIKDANPAAASLLGASVEALIGSQMALEFEVRKGEFSDILVGLGGGNSGSEIDAKTARTQQSVTIKPTVFRAGGERLIACQLIRSNAEAQAEDHLPKILRALFQRGPEGIAICALDGTIEEVNEAFLELAGLTSAGQATGRSLAEFLYRGQIDLSVMLENAARTGRMRGYATRISNEHGLRASVEFSAVHLDDKEKPSVGFFIRDAERAEALRRATHPANQTQASNHNVVELVGSASLKEIVAETNDVIEKICIETAVELTGNNRAAAAEMLGLSRQSLYVKLRKYGLLERAEGS
jgi:transcriptional regulator PpsR